MKKLLLLLLMCASARGQATNPQNTFDGAVSVNNPSLWLNFNDATASFKDSVSGQSFVGAKPSSAAAGSPCTYGAPTSASLTCSLTTTATDAIVVWIDALSSATVSSLVDSLGATAVLINHPANGIYAYYFANVAAGSHTITATMSSAPANVYPAMTAVDVVNAATSSPVDAYGYNTQTATIAVTSGPLTTTAAGDLLIANVGEGTSGGTWTAGSPAFSVFTGVYNSQVNGTYAAGAAGSYTFNVTAPVSLPWSTWTVAIKSKTFTSGTIATQQPGFDNTNNANFSAQFPYNAWAAAPNNAMGSTMEWNTPWTMMIHVDKMNWDGIGTYTIASKGDISGTSGTSWQLYVAQNSGRGNTSELCFVRRGYSAPVNAVQTFCSSKYIDMVPNTFNYNIIVEDSGTGTLTAISMWINGYAISLQESQTFGTGFGGATAAITSAGTGFTASVNFTSTGGGTNCVVTGTATESGGALNSIPTINSSGCTSAPTIVLTSPTGTGAVITATAYSMTMNSPMYPLMVPGYVSNGAYYGPGGSDTAQGALNADEFAEFPGNLPVTAISNIFYETKFYQNFLYPGLQANPPLVIFEGYGCGPDFSGTQTLAMIVGEAKAGLIRLIGLIDDDGQPNGYNSIGLWRQMLDQAGLADVQVGWGKSSPYANLGGCPAATITAYNANTPQNQSSYPSAASVIRTQYAKYPSKPIDFLMTQTATGYNDFQLSAADGISSLTGLQLQAQNYANGGWVNAYNGNFEVDNASYVSFFNNYGAGPVYTWGGTPDQGGPGIFTSRTANDPIYMVAFNNNDSDYISGWTNLNASQMISPYFQGGVTVALSGGTGYAASTKFTSTGGGPNCNVTGIMTASSGVPNNMQTAWGITVSSTATYNGIGYGCTPASFIATGSGTNLTVSAVSLGMITVGDTLVGTGISTGTTIVSQTSGTTGGVGVYVTSAATTASAARVTRQPTVVLTAPTGTGVVMTVTCGIFPSAYGGSNLNQFIIFPSQWAMESISGYGNGPIFRWFQNSLIDPPTTGTPRRD